MKYFKRQQVSMSTDVKVLQITQQFDVIWATLGLVSIPLPG